MYRYVCNAQNDIIGPADEVGNVWIRKIKMQNVVLMLISFILYDVFDGLEMYSISIQFILFGYWQALSGIVRYPRILEELVLIEYPKERYRKKKRYYFFSGFKVEDEPVDFIRMERILALQFVFFSAFLWITGDGGKALGTVIEKIFVFGELFTVIVFWNYMYKIAFYKKYKRLSKCNWKYRLGLGKFEQQPQKNKMGKCNIIKEVNTGRKKYYVVQEKRNGNVYEKVLYCGEGICDLKREHILYEICKVKYII